MFLSHSAFKPLPTTPLKQFCLFCLLPFVCVGQTLAGFINDETLKRVVVRSIEIIGEASKKIPSSFKQHHSSIEWRNMAGMRDRLIHNYMGVDFTIDWDVLKTRIPILHLQIETLLGEID